MVLDATAVPECDPEFPGTEPRIFPLQPHGWTDYSACTGRINPVLSFQVSSANMVSTRSSTASPRTRSSTSRNTSFAFLPPSPPRDSLERKHAGRFPLTVSLGIKGTLAMKRRAVNDELQSAIRFHSPRPSPADQLPVNYQNHRLVGPIMNTGARRRNDGVAGAWAQPVCLFPPFFLICASTNGFN